MFYKQHCLIDHFLSKMRKLNREQGNDIAFTNAFT